VDSEAVALRVLAHFRPGNKVIEQLAAESEWLDVVFVAEEDDDAFYRELPEAEVIWHNLRPLSAEDLARAPKLRLVHKLGAGVDTIDVAAATRQGVLVANMPGANAPSVAEAALLLMLGAMRRLPALDRATRDGKGWPAETSLGDEVRDLGSCTLGLVGYGNVAKRVETFVHALGTQVVHTSRRRDENNANWVTLNDLLKKCDVVSLHLPLTPDTAGLIDAKAIASMKRGAVLVNTSRGGVVDETALAEALQSGQLAAAGLDVFAEEPVSKDNPLLQLDNVLVMPHVSWFTADTMNRYLLAAVKNCRRLHDGKRPNSVVNNPQ
jgi:phosphoglycerate dehydrogenase-like enzyme